MKTFFSAVCVVVLMVVFPTTLLFTLVQSQLLNANALKQVSRDAKVGEAIPSIVASNAGVSEAEVNKFLPTKTTYAITDVIIDTAIGAALDGKEKINIKPLKTELEPVAKDLFADAEAGMNYTDIPPFSLNDEVTLSELMAGDSQDRNSGTSTFNLPKLNWLPLSTTIGWMIMIVASLGLVLLKRKPVRNLFKWLGITTGLLMLETIPLAVTFWLLPSIVSPLLNDMDTNVRVLLVTVIERLSASVAWSSVWIAIGLLITTIVLLISRLFIKPRQA